MSFGTVQMSVLALSAVAFSSAFRTPMSTSVAPPAAKCEELEPKKLPSLDALFDSAALVGRLLAVQGAENGDDIVSVRLGNGSASRVMNTETPTTEQQAVAAAVLASLKGVPAGAPQYVRVKVRRGARPVLSLARSVLCAPVSLSREDPSGDKRLAFVVGPASGGGARLLSSQPSTGNSNGKSPPIRVLVSVVGAVLEVDFGNNSTGSVQTDGELRQKYLAVRYAPAMLDGAPVPVWVNGKNVELANP